jgi:iron only hydrogenase large subunit-like protein
MKGRSWPISFTGYGMAKLCRTAVLRPRPILLLPTLEPSTFDNPYMTAYSGAGAIFGPTGGVMEAALRTMYKIVTGSELKMVELTQLRGFEGRRSATVDYGNSIGVVKVAMCHGLKATREIAEEVRAGTADFDFIEIMAFPGGCVDGGATLQEGLHDPRQQTPRDYVRYRSASGCLPIAQQPAGQGAVR